MNLSINKDIYQNIIKSSNHIIDKNLSLRYCNTKNYKIGFIIPKSLGPAHQRNLFKRRCRSALLGGSRNSPIAVLVSTNKLNIKYKNIKNTFDNINLTTI